MCVCVIIPCGRYKLLDKNGILHCKAVHCVRYLFCPLLPAIRMIYLSGNEVRSSLIDHDQPIYIPTPPPRGFDHMVISGYLDHPRTQFRLSASELLLFVSVVLVLINALYGIPNCDDLVS